MNRNHGVREQHPMAGRTVKLKLHQPDRQIKTGDLFEIEDWYQNVSGKRWTVSVLGGNFAAMNYEKRAVSDAKALYSDFEPVDDVVYGKVGPFGHIVHASELAYRLG